MWGKLLQQSSGTDRETLVPPLGGLPCSRTPLVRVCACARVAERERDTHTQRERERSGEVEAVGMYCRACWEERRLSCQIRSFSSLVSLNQTPPTSFTSSSSSSSRTDRPASQARDGGCVKPGRGAEPELHCSVTVTHVTEDVQW